MAHHRRTGWIALVWALAQVAAVEGAELRNVQGAPPPIFVSGPAVEPVDELRRWLATQAEKHPRALLKLPFTFSRGEPGRAVSGAWRVRLDDSALGISLADRLAQACKDPAQPCTLWLSVRSGPVVGGEAGVAEEPVFSVFAVHERLAAAVPARELRAQIERPKECLSIRLLDHGHCARGEKSCAECREAAARPASPALLDLCPDGAAARPTIAVERAGKKQWRAYEVIERFSSLEEARDFAALHAIDDLRLEAAAP